MSDKNLTTQSPQLLQMANIKDIKTWYNEFVKLSKDVLKTDLDYGIIPGVSKPSLFKPGAEKLRFVYGLQTETICVDKIFEKDEEIPYIDYTYRTTVKSPDGSRILATSEGNANSYESKFRFVWVNEANLPEGVDKDHLATRSNTIQEFAFAIEKAETGGKYGKPAEYWEKWQKAITDGTAKKIQRKTSIGKTMDGWEMGGLSYRIENPDVIGLKNTIMKMADKRSFVGAILKATGASEFFTQDVEDMEIPVDDVAEVVKAKVVEPKTEVKQAEAEVKKDTSIKTRIDKAKAYGQGKEQVVEGEVVEEQQEEVKPAGYLLKQAKLKWIKALVEKGKIEGGINYEAMSLDELTEVMDNYRKTLGK